MRGLWVARKSVFLIVPSVVSASSDRAQPHAVVVLELEDHPFARREPAQGADDALLQFPTSEASLRAGRRTVIGHAVEGICRARRPETSSYSSRRPRELFLRR